MSSDYFMGGLMVAAAAIVLFLACSLSYATGQKDITTQCSDFGAFKTQGQFYTCAKQVRTP